MDCNTLDGRVKSCLYLLQFELQVCLLLLTLDKCKCLSILLMNPGNGEMQLLAESLLSTAEGVILWASTWIKPKIIRKFQCLYWSISSEFTVKVAKKCLNVF